MKAVAASPARTQSQLVEAATALFAARGFHATTVREIAARAGVNVASGHYHYGSKKALYLEVLRAQFATIRETLRQRGGAVEPAALARLGRPALVRLLEARIQTMLDMLIGPPAAPHAALMQREMCDPSEALPVIVGEFIRPVLDEMVAIVARLEPDLDRATLERCVFSIVGQAHFYQLVQPAMLHLRGWSRYPAGFSKQLAAHVTAFSLGGLARIAATAHLRRRRAR